MKPKGLTLYYGIWAGLVDEFTGPGLARMLGCTEPDLIAYSSNRVPVPEARAWTVRGLCFLHGIRPVLYVNADWKNHQGVIIASVPEGWMAWSLNAKRTWPVCSRWCGHPIELKPADALTVNEAILKGWSYGENVPDQS